MTGRIIRDTKIKNNKISLQETRENIIYQEEYGFKRKFKAVGYKFLNQLTKRSKLKWPQKEYTIFINQRWFLDDITYTTQNKERKVLQVYLQFFYELVS